MFHSKKRQLVLVSFLLVGIVLAFTLLLRLTLSAQKVAEILTDVFDLDAQCAAHILTHIRFTSLEIGQTLKDVYEWKAPATAQILLELGFTEVDIGIVLRDAYDLTAYDAGVVLKGLGLSEYTIQSILIETYDTYAVIVDIKSVINDPPGLLDYTGLGECNEEQHNCTEPYIPGLFGKRIAPFDVNKGIGGDYRYVYVKYDLVPKTSSQEVVTAIQAQHWAYWQVSCPDGWTPVGALTTKTKSSCYRIGLCALYKPFNEAETFVTNTGISYGKWGNPASRCQAVCGANSNLWPMYTDGLDIHWGCEDEVWVYFCYNQAQAWPSRPLTMEFTEDEKLTLLEQYAPRLIFHPNERFYPSSVEWSFDHLFRYSPNDLPDFIPDFDSKPFEYLFYHLFVPPDDRYYVATKQTFASPSDWFDYHYGCNGSATSTPCRVIIKSCGLPR